MAVRPPRVALFTDSYHDVSGVARTCRNFEDYALRRQLPLLMVRAGSRSSLSDRGSMQFLELRPVLYPFLWTRACGSIPAPCATRGGRNPPRGRSQPS